MTLKKYNDDDDDIERNDNDGDMERQYDDDYDIKNIMIITLKDDGAWSSRQLLNDTTLKNRLNRY